MNELNYPLYRANILKVADASFIICNRIMCVILCDYLDSIGELYREDCNYNSISSKDVLACLYLPMRVFYLKLHFSNVILNRYREDGDDTIVGFKHYELFKPYHDADEFTVDIVNDFVRTVMRDNKRYFRFVVYEYMKAFRLRWQINNDNFIQKSKRSALKSAHKEDKLELALNDAERFASNVIKYIVDQLEVSAVEHFVKLRSMFINSCSIASMMYNEAYAFNHSSFDTRDNGVGVQYLYRGVKPFLKSSDFDRLLCRGMSSDARLQVDDFLSEFYNKNVRLWWRTVDRYTDFVDNGYIPIDIIQ